MFNKKLEVIAIIPARGGSERIPRKNVTTIAGKPLIAWTIEQALNSRQISRTIVSTDNHEINKISRMFGAEVIDRPSGLSQSDSSSESALLHTLDHLAKFEGYIPDLIVFLQATSPLRRPIDIDEAISTLVREDADSLLSVSPIPGSGFLWHSKDGVASPVNFDPSNRPRSQDFTQTHFAENGSIYVFHRHVLEEFNCRLGGRITIYRQPLEYSFELDTPADLAILENLINQLSADS